MPMHSPTISVGSNIQAPSSHSSTIGSSLARRRWFIEKGANRVVIIAVWLQGLPDVFDAFNVAAALGFRNLDPFLHEVLLYRVIFADSYRILAIFHGDGPAVDVALSAPYMTLTTQVPRDFVAEVQTWTFIGIAYHKDITETLREEMYALTGTVDEGKLLQLMLSMGGMPYYRESRNGTTELHSLFGMRWHFTPLIAA